MLQFLLHLVQLQQEQLTFFLRFLQLGLALGGKGLCVGKLPRSLCPGLFAFGRAGTELLVRLFKGGFHVLKGVLHLRNLA